MDQAIAPAADVRWEDSSDQKLTNLGTLREGLLNQRRYTGLEMAQLYVCVRVWMKTDDYIG